MFTCFFHVRVDDGDDDGRVGQSVESALIALAAIFLAHIAYFSNFRQKYCILTCRDKRESYLIVLQQNNV